MLFGFKNSPTNVKIWHFITKWLFGLHSCEHFSVSINSFYGNKDYKLAGNFKLPATKIFTCEIIYVQVEIIEMTLMTLMTLMTNDRYSL